MTLETPNRFLLALSLQDLAIHYFIQTLFKIEGKKQSLAHETTSTIPAYCWYFNLLVFCALAFA
tara:strand:+ start:221 stop:412 length:192 start_codon:yes stop_codon:yes gene_type:complete